MVALTRLDFTNKLSPEPCTMSLKFMPGFQVPATLKHTFCTDFY